MARNRSILEFNSSSLSSAVAQPLQGAALLESVSRQTGQIANDAISTWQAAEVKKATEEGAIAGGLPQVDFRKGDTLTADAFNKAATKTWLATTQTRTTAKLNELQFKYPDDPAKFLEASTALIDTTIGTISESSQLKQYAAPLEAQLRASQESMGYTVSKKYREKAIEEAKAANEDYMFTVKNDAYRQSADIFSADEISQGYALNNFANAKNLFEASIHAVTPDGQPVYDAGEIAAMRREFHTGFYTQAVKDFVTSGAMSSEQATDLLSGNLKVTIPVKGGKSLDIDVLSEVGIDTYGKLQSFATTKLREQAAAAKAASAKEEADAAEARKVNGFHLATQIASGQPIPLDTIDAMLANGEIDYTTAVRAQNMATDPPTLDDVNAVTQINAMIANGADAAELISASSGNLKPNTLVALSKANETMIANGRTSLMKEHLKMIKAEFGEKTLFGEFTDTNMAAAYNDIQLDYTALVADGMDPQLAFEKMRDVAEGVKKADEMGKFQRFKEILIKQDGIVDQNATFNRLMQLNDDGVLDDDLMLYYMEKIETNGEE